MVKHVFGNLGLCRKELSSEQLLSSSSLLTTARNGGGNQTSPVCSGSGPDRLRLGRLPLARLVHTPAKGRSDAAARVSLSTSPAPSERTLDLCWNSLHQSGIKFYAFDHSKTQIHILRNSASSFHWLFTCSLFVCPALVTSPQYDVLDHTNHIFSESIWSWQHVSVIHCWVEPSLLLSSFWIKWF